MRYRLRTLLIVVTVSCLVLAWVTHSRRMAQYHSREAVRLISQIAQTEKSRPVDIENSIRMLEDDATTKIPRVGKLFGQSVVHIHVPNGPMRLLFQTDPDHWQQAIDHRKRSKAYQHAAWRPWLLISGKLRQ
jgi:hypothetical protein